MTLDLEQLRAATGRLLDAIPAAEIGDVYCDEGGEDFYRATAPRIVELGTELAKALVKQIHDRQADAAGTSLYIGAGIAEVPMMLGEVLGAGRRVVACNRRGAECELLERAFQRSDVVPKGAVEIHALDAGRVVGDSLPEGVSLSHVSMVSVLTDPEAFPQVSGLTYGRLAPVLMDVEAFEAERTRIRSLLDRVFGALSMPGLITTTGEEGPWVFDWAARQDQGVEVEVDDVALEAAVVGDPVGFLHVTSAAQAAAQ